MNTELKTAAAYIRVSTDKQTELSPDSQLRIIKEYAKQNGYILPAEYIFREDGLSGKSVKRRPQFIEMIGLAKQKPAPFSAILVWKFSRFARNQEESIVYKSMLKKNDVSVISCSEALDEDNPFSSLIERIIEWMDEYYSIRLSGEVKRGMTEKAQRGQPVSVPSFGYDIENKKYIINEEKAAIVRKMFTDYLNGKSCSNIALELNALGIKTTRGNLFEQRTVSYILKNPIYAGQIRWNKGGRIDYRYFLNDESEIIYAQGEHTPIIDKETFDKVQELLEINARKHRKGTHSKVKKEYMLHGLVKCSSCGAALARSTAQGLQCIKYSKCTCTESHYIAFNKINKLVILGIEKAFTTGSFKLTNRTAKTDPQQNIDYHTLIAKEQQKLDRIKAAYLEGVYTVDEVKEYKASIENTINNLKSRIAKPQLSESELKKKFIKKNKNLLSDLKNPNTSEKEKNEILKSFVDHIIFNRSTSSVDIFFYI